MGSKFNKPATTLTDRGALLIHGFLREIVSTTTTLAIEEIFNLCHKFYTVPQFIYMYDHTAFHVLNVTSPSHPMLSKYLIKTNDKSTSLNKPFDLCCYIPDIMSVAPSMKHSFEESKHNGQQYDAILSRAHSKIDESGESSRSLYLFPNRNIGIQRPKKAQSEHRLLQSPTGNRGKLLNHMLYCGDKWGIIGTGGALVPVLYQLKLQNISDKKFIFNEISNEANAEKVWGRHPGYQCKQYLMLNYMRDKEMLFGVQCKQEHGASVTKKPPSKQYMDARCGLYDLTQNKWTAIHSFRFSKYLNDDEDNFKCGLSYNQSIGDAMYLVSSLGRTARFDFKLGCWKVLYENVENFNDQTMRYDMGPIVWSYHHTPHILYCIGARKQHKNNKYILQYKQFDVRNERRKWIDCLSKQTLKQIKDLDFKSIFV